MSAEPSLTSHSAIERLLRPLVEMRAAALSDLIALSGVQASMRELEAEGLVRIARIGTRTVCTLGPKARLLFPRLQRTATYGALSEASIVWGWTRTALRAALVNDGWEVRSDDGGRTALRDVLLEDTRRKLRAIDGERGAIAGMAKMQTRLALSTIESLSELQPSQQPLPWDVACRGAGEEREAIVVFVEQPFQSLKRQLDGLPLQVVGQARVKIVLRPAEDGSVVDEHGTPLVRGARWRSLLRAFTKTTRPTAGFPLWTTADVVAYRPEIFFRTLRRER